MDRIDYTKAIKLRELREPESTFLRIDYDLLAKVIQAKHDRKLPVVNTWKIINPHKKAS